VRARRIMLRQRHDKDKIGNVTETADKMKDKLHKN
jgi:hypothetical protein